MEPAERPLRTTARAMLDGLLLRCPRCEEGRMPRSLFGIGGRCDVCGQDFELGAGDFSGAIMIAQMLMGLLVIPTWVLLTLFAPFDFTARVVWTLLILTTLLLLFYRNIKGMWFGFLLSADRVQQGPAPRG